LRSPACRWAASRPRLSLIGWNRAPYANEPDWGLGGRCTTGKGAAGALTAGFRAAVFETMVGALWRPSGAGRRCTGARHELCRVPCARLVPAGAVSGCCAVGGLLLPNQGLKMQDGSTSSPPVLPPTLILSVNADLEPWDPDPTHQSGDGLWRAWVHRRRFNRRCARPVVRTCHLWQAFIKAGKQNSCEITVLASNRANQLLAVRNPPRLSPHTFCL
jgi:hypothetical protein